MFTGAETQGVNATSLRISPVLSWECNFEPTSLHDLLWMRTVARKNITERCAKDLLIYEGEIGLRRVQSRETPEGGPRDTGHQN